MNTITIPGNQMIFAFVILFALIGIVRGWPKMSIVFCGTLLTALVLLEDKEERLIKVVNSIPKIIDLLLDTKLGTKPIVTAANKSYFMLIFLLVGLLVFWILSSRLNLKSKKLDFCQPCKTLPGFLLSAIIGAATGYVLLVKVYEYILVFPKDAQKKIFQAITIVLQPLPTTNILRQYEALLFLVIVVLILLIPPFIIKREGEEEGEENKGKSKSGGRKS